MRGLRLLTGLAAGALLVSCGGGGDVTPPDTPTPGFLTVTLGGTVPTGAGAIELTVTSATRIIDSLHAGAGYTAYNRTISTKSIRTILVGSVAAGTLTSIHVPDTRKVADYVVSVDAAANGTSLAAMTASAFAVSISAP